ncbi:ATP-binding protein [Kitasatospora sp. NPDC057542]|uniref:ATP-binding protein n=1 Tax=Kitasatospora sp. NPDC057542 TaxID=3346162 RepID=UPI0036AB2DA1
MTLSSPAASASIACHPVRPDVLILDDFAMRQLTAAQADDLYELVSERQGRSLIITSNRAPATGIRSCPTPSSPNRSWTG